MSATCDFRVVLVRVQPLHAETQQSSSHIQAEQVENSQIPNQVLVETMSTGKVDFKCPQTFFQPVPASD